jgi:hypothetical protein
MNEHEHEPVRGLPDFLPDGEHMVWQGGPGWRPMALRVFHVRKVAVYFVLLGAVHIGLQWVEGASLATAGNGALWLITLGAMAIGILALLAWLYSKTTIYTMTDRRLVLRFGVAVPMMINIPWDRIDSVGMLRHKDGSGDIILTLSAGRKMSYWLLWPHAKPWRFSPVHPSLRALASVEDVAERLQQAIAGQTKNGVLTPITRSAGGRRQKDTTERAPQTAAYS